MAGNVRRIALCFPSLTDVAFLMPIVFLFGRLEGAGTLLSDGDTGWHIRAGEWILRRGQVPHTDLFSYTRAGQPWFAWEWLAEIIMAWLYRWWGMAAVVLAGTIVLSATFAALFRTLHARSGNPLIAIFLTGIAVAGSSIHWLARPHLATLLFTVVFLAALESGSRRLLWTLPPLTVLWANLHAGFLFGIGLIVLYALAGGRSICRLAWTALLAGAASLANPYGWRLHRHIWKYLGADSWQFDHIHEFLSPDFHAPLAICFELVLALSLAAAAWHAMRRRFHYVALTVATGHMALVSARNIPLFLIVASLPVSVAMVECFQWTARRVPKLLPAARGFLRLSAEVASVERFVRIPVTSGLAALVLAAVLFAPAASGKLRCDFNPHRFPARAVEQVSTSRDRIFTSDQWGDYLIYRLYPEIRVFVDGRSDFYGAEHEQLCQDVWSVRYDWEQKLARFGVDTLLLPADTPLAGAVKESRHWRVVYDDGQAILFRAAAGEPVSGLAVLRQSENSQSSKERTQ